MKSERNYATTTSGNNELKPLPYTVGNPLRSVGYRRWAARESALAMGSPRTMKERVFGVYLTYSLFFLQPSEHVQLVRISVGQFKELGQLLREVLVPEGWVEAAFCLMRLVRGHAFAVGPFEVEVSGLESDRSEA